MTLRRALPNRREHEVHDLEFRGRAYVVGFGRFEDGSLAEVFIDARKQSTDAADDARDGALVLSLALQHGTPAETIRHAVTRSVSGVPAGIIGAVLDLLADTDESSPASPAEPSPISTKPTTPGGAREEARLRGYVGESCPDCGNFTLVRNGACLKCETCGATTGCS